MNIQNKLILGFWKREQRIQKNCYGKIMQIGLSQKVTNEESYGCWLVSVQRCHDRWTALDMFTSLLLVTAFLKLMQIRRLSRGDDEVDDIQNSPICKVERVAKVINCLTMRQSAPEYTILRQRET